MIKLKTLLESSNVVELAKQFAINAHDGQFRRDGTTPYIVHPEDVAKRVHGDDVAEAVSWLHDTLEDNKHLKKEDLLRYGIPKNVIDVVVLMSHIDDTEPYFDYIKRIKLNPIAKKVKLADIASNLASTPTEKQREKYKKALEILNS